MSDRSDRVMSTTSHGAGPRSLADRPHTNGRSAKPPADELRAPARRAAGRGAQSHLRLLAMPEIRRVSMVPSPIDRHPVRRMAQRLLRWVSRSDSGHEAAWVRDAADAGHADAGWRALAYGRRAGLVMLVLAQTGVAAWFLQRTFPYPSLTGVEIATLAVFSLLWAWISLGFWTAVAGFFVRWREAAPRWVAEDPSDRDVDRPLPSRTAIVVPIYNEDVRRVFAGIEATYRSLSETGRLDAFDFYVLSDTRDPDTRAEEAAAWAEACSALHGFGRLFYRNRRNNIKRKSGNIADFLRRWGRNYEYMIVFDADSVMAGETLVRLVRLMDRHPRAGIIQTVPSVVNRESLFARVQQFASRAYGPMLAAGLQFWQLGESYYWGHNAIIRCEAFMKHCGLSRLPGEAPLGGEILSHDFVEAALMGRAGWEVWITCELDGSYEEAPPTLLDELKRDRRWCQGNLQHLRLLFGDGIRSGHRAIMAMGVMAYSSALFWAAFLVLSTMEVVERWLTVPKYFSSSPSLFPLWPEWHPEFALALLSTTGLLLLLPKLLSVMLITKAGRTRQFGSFTRLCLSVVLEIVLSTLLAPIRMWFHGKFVLMTLLGRQITWGAQCRTDVDTRWRDAVRQHGPSTLVALAWLAGLASLSWSLMYWLLPVVAALFLSIPVSVYTSRVSLGRAFRRCGLFVTPEETRLPEVIERLHAALDRRPHASRARPRPLSLAIAWSRETDAESARAAHR